MEYEKGYNQTLMNPTSITHSQHALRRASQRGIETSSLDIVIREGRVIYKQGIKFFFMTEKELRYHNSLLLNKLRNLVVVMAGDEDVIITCYKNKNAQKSIKHKNKRLLKNVNIFYN